MFEVRCWTFIIFFSDLTGRFFGKAALSGLREKYPTDYILNSYFYMVDYVRDRFRAAWDMHILSGQNNPEVTKQTLHFIKR